ncbi:MAG: hypothetical protein H7123_08745 [Thermoleophilia bacterium]|nr:hypothetical protein [Thermoleophilia bacterium]
MDGMIAAVRVELRAFWGQMWVRFFLTLIALSPLILMVLQWLSRTLLDGASNEGLSYADSLYMVVLVAGVGAAFIGQNIAHTPHRHDVFQSYVVTGYPRDLMFLARLMAAWLTSLALGLFVLVTSLVIHALTYPQRPPVAGVYSEAISQLSVGAVACDAVTVLLMLLLATTFMVGLVTVTRSIVGALAFIGIYLALEGTALSSSQHRWQEQAQLVPLDHIHDIPVTYHEPFWSVMNAVPRLTHAPFHESWLTGFVLLFGWCLLMGSAAVLRMVRGDT